MKYFAVLTLALMASGAQARVCGTTQRELISANGAQISIKVAGEAPIVQTIVATDQASLDFLMASSVHGGRLCNERRNPEAAFEICYDFDPETSEITHIYCGKNSLCVGLACGGIGL